MGWAEAMHRKVERELRPLRDAIESSTGKWRLFGSKDELTTTTFGPLEKYVAANDNVPQADRGIYVGLRRSIADDPECQAFERRANEQGVQHARPASTDSGQPERHGDFMQTATGRKFWPLSPRAEEVFIEDIAHSLSLQCRYAGHVLRFYSVAEHSVLIARHLCGQYDEQTALWGLLHDASEAYLVDVPRPVKPYLTGYKDAEAKVMAAVCDRFGLMHEMPAAVHDADNRIIADELANLVPMDWHARYVGRELGVRLRYWSPEEAKMEFLATFDALTGRGGGRAA